MSQPLAFVGREVGSCQMMEWCAHKPASSGTGGYWEGVDREGSEREGSSVRSSASRVEELPSSSR